MLVHNMLDQSLDVLPSNEVNQLQNTCTPCTVPPSQLYNKSLVLQQHLQLLDIADYVLWDEVFQWQG